MIQQFRRDAMLTLRTLRRNPGFAVVSILTLGLGIGASTAIFSVVNGILLTGLPFPEADRLISLCETWPDEEGTCVTASPPNASDWAEQSSSLEGIGLFRWWGHQLETEEGVQGVRSLIATPEFFRIMGYRAAVGRVLRPEDQLEGNRRVAVLDYDFWMSRFGGDPEIVGTSLVFSGEPFQVIGVMQEGQKPPTFSGEPRADVWMPLHIGPRDNAYRDWRGFYAVGRLAPGASLEVARQELGVIRQGLAEEHPEENASWGLELTTLQDRTVGHVRTTLLFFLGSVVLVLIITCANIANLILARLSSRETELGIRAAIGADASRLAGLLLAEGFVLALLGGSLGLVLAWLGTPLFVSLAPAGIPRLHEVGMDPVVLAFTLGMAGFATVLFGLAPLARRSLFQPMQALRRERGGRPRGFPGGINGILVVSEVALAMTLLVGAGLLTRSFAAFYRWDPGIDQEHILTFSLSSNTSAYQDDGAVINLYYTLDEALAGLPGVRAVGRGSAGPLFGGWEPDQVFPAEEAGLGGEGRQARFYDVSADYFESLGLSVLEGRSFTPDDDAESPFVALVNESLAGTLWPGEDPIGREVWLEVHDHTWTVIGVVPDIPPLDPDAAQGLAIYFTQSQYTRPFTYFTLRTEGDPEALSNAVVERVQAVDPELEPARFRTYEDLMRGRLVQPRFTMLLTGIFSLVATVLAAVGIFGVVARSVAARTREIGIRIALGARQFEVVREVMTRAVFLTGVGIALGLAISLALSRFIRSLLHGVVPTDPLTYALVALGLFGVALLASLIPAAGATRGDPMESLRAEG